MTPLAEMYLNISVDIESKEFLEIEKLLKKEGKKIASELFESEITFEVRIEDGSLKT
jgi:hypothetical protein